MGETLATRRSLTFLEADVTPEQKEWIDKATLIMLLRKWRFSASGDPMLQGEAGVYFSKRMFGMRDADHVAWTRASKQLGW